MKQIDFDHLSKGNIHSKRDSYVPSDLKKCTHVWLRTDRVRRSLECPYTGPYKVLKRLDKVFVIEDFTGAEKCVSIDRLKPAYVQSAPCQARLPVVLPKPNSPVIPVSNENDVVESPECIRTYKTRSGRNVRFNVDKNYVYY